MRRRCPTRLERTRDGRPCALQRFLLVGPRLRVVGARGQSRGGAAVSISDVIAQTRPPSCQLRRRAPNALPLLDARGRRVSHLGVLPAHRRFPHRSFPLLAKPPRHETGRGRLYISSNLEGTIRLKVELRATARWQGWNVIEILPHNLLNDPHGLELKRATQATPQPKPRRTTKKKMENRM